MSAGQWAATSGGGDISPRDQVIAGYGRLAGDGGPTVLVPGEALIALEALARGIGAAGVRVLSIESSRYGRWTTGWLREAGAEVEVLSLVDGDPVDPDQVDAVVRRTGARAVLLTQAEALTGVAHPVDAVVAAAHARDAIVAVDAVAAVGGLPAPAADAVVIGPQKALDGPAGLSTATLSARAWDLLGPAPAIPSVLSLPHLRRQDLAGGGPGMPSDTELALALEALGRVQAEGLAARQARHRRTGAAVRAGLVTAGLTPWVRREEDANPLATTVTLPEGIDGAAVVAAAEGLGGRWATGARTERGEYLRVSHYGRAAGADRALTEVVALATALHRAGHGTDPGAAAEAVLAAWGSASTPSLEGNAL